MRASVLAAVRGARGIEIGGPSQVFTARGILPIYPEAREIDNVNFSTDTAWEHGLSDNGAFVFDPTKAPGKQYLREASDLEGIADASYSFIISSHCLEHLANPLRALREWLRIAAPGGYLVLLLPDPTRTFDRKRPITTFRHLEDDQERGTGEDDLSHLDEILKLHDLGRDPGAGSAEQFRARAADNPRNRCLHHHVFDIELLCRCLDSTGWSVISTERIRPLHLAAFARKNN